MPKLRSNAKQPETILYYAVPTTIYFVGYSYMTIKLTKIKNNANNKNLNQRNDEKENKVLYAIIETNIIHIHAPHSRTNPSVEYLLCSCLVNILFFSNNKIKKNGLVKG